MKRLLTSIPLWLFLLHGILIYPFFLPNLSEIILFDEAGYVNSGRTLFQGSLPIFSSNPLAAFLYLLTYLPVKDTRLWLLHSITFGRGILFALLWTSLYLIVRQLRGYAHPITALALLLITPVLTNLMSYPSDALFTAMAGFALWQMLCFHNRLHSVPDSTLSEVQNPPSRLRSPTFHLWIGSVFVGLAALSRNDGLILLPIFTLLGFILHLRQSPPPRLFSRSSGAVLMACLLPFIALVGGYLLLYQLRTGTFTLGTLHRSYVAFKQGQGVAYPHLYPEGNLFFEGQIEARRLYGTPAENDYSILNAIRRNPSAFVQRIWQVMKNLPRQLLSIYGGGVSALLFLCALRGVIALYRRKARLLLGILLGWTIFLGVYFLTFFRPGYLLLPFFVPFALAALGITAALANFGNRRERAFWFTAMFLFAIIAIPTKEPLLLRAGLAAGVGYAIVWVLKSRYPDLMERNLAAFLLLLGVAFAIGRNIPAPEFRVLGSAPDERAVLFMQRQLPLGARVASYAPGPVFTARMSYVPLNFELRDLTSDEFGQWMTKQGLKAIYVDDRLRNNEPWIWANIQEFIGQSLEVVFDSPTVQVLFVTSAP